MYREYVKEYLSVDMTDVERVSYPSMIACKLQQYLADMGASMYDDVITSYEKDWEDKGFDMTSGMGIHEMSLKAGGKTVTITHAKEFFRVMRFAAHLGIADHLEYEATYYYNATIKGEPVYEDGTGAFSPAYQYFEKLLKDPDCAKHMTFRSISQGEQLNDIILASSPAGSDETMYGDSVLCDGMDGVADIDTWTSDLLNFSIHFPENTEGELTQSILQQLRELGKKYFTEFDLKTDEKKPFDVDDYVDIYEGEYSIDFSKGRLFSREELAAFRDEVQAVAQLVIQAKGAAEVEGWLLSDDKKNLYAAAYMKLAPDGKMQFFAAKL